MKHVNRRVVLRKRDRLNKEDLILKSGMIKKKLFCCEDYVDARTVMFYVSFGSEVDTMDMIRESLKEKTVCVPVVKGHKIVPSVITDIKELCKKNKYGILEPLKLKRMDKKSIDLVIVPGIVFDKDNRRIGYGKGYYDDFLKDFRGKKVGLAFDLQVLEVIPKDDWDMALDALISA